MSMNAVDPTPSQPASGASGLDRQVWLVASVVVLGAVMVILDTTVVAVAINTLAGEFNTSLATIQWIATGYTLALATVIPLSGWAADRFGTKRLFLVSIVLFMAGSVASGLAWSAGSLIAFRVLQGFGGGMLMPVGMTILTRAAGPQRVGRVMSVIGVPMLLGPIFGPILGGWLVDDFSWRWIFFINIPVGVVALIMTLRVLPRDVPAPGHPLDWLGLALLSPSLAALIYGLAESGSKGEFAIPSVLVPGILGALGLAMFIWRARRTPDPLVDLRLFANRVFSAAGATLMLMVISVFGGMFLLPVYLQAVRGESAMASGLLMAPQGLGAMIAMPIAGLLTDRTGVGRIVPVGLATVGVSFAALTQLAGDTSYWLLSGILFLLGAGMGATMMPTFSGAMQTLRKVDVAHASTALNIIQQVGASIGTAVLSVILTAELRERLPGGGGGTIGQSAGIPDEVRRQVAPLMADAFGATFWWALALVIVAFLVALVLLPKHKPAPVEDEEEGQITAPLPLG